MTGLLRAIVYKLLRFSAAWLHWWRFEFSSVKSTRESAGLVFSPSSLGQLVFHVCWFLATSSIFYLLHFNFLYLKKRISLQIFFFLMDSTKPPMSLTYSLKFCMDEKKTIRKQSIVFYKCLTAVCLFLICNAPVKVDMKTNKKLCCK